MDRGTAPTGNDGSGRERVDTEGRGPLHPRTQPQLALGHVPISGREKWRNATSTFVHNMKLPVHGWFRFPAGFSGEWAREVVQASRGHLGAAAVLDPFAGVGTAILAAEEAGATAIGIEAQPFIARLAQAKLLWGTPVGEFTDTARRILGTARRMQRLVPEYPPVIQKCFPKDVLRDLHCLRCALDEAHDGTASWELCWLALCSILRACSPAGTAPWQYVLPKQRKAVVASPYEAFPLQIDRMASDMRYRSDAGTSATGQVLCGDARECSGVEDDSVGLVVTSPPYANNYDYADATRLEMSFFGEVWGWADLHEHARKRLVRSCSQHVAVENDNLESLLQTLADVPFHAQLTRACRELGSEREKHGGRKHYHVMIAAYFADMQQVWMALKRVCRPGAVLCWVVGDSAPYGIHVPVEKWLGELAISCGFHRWRFEKLRDRNVKWRNRKHKVPLHEGRLWVEG